jgi:PAS domain S-box-containing protein
MSHEPTATTAGGNAPEPPERGELLARLNADLQRSRDLLRTIFDGLDDGLLLVGNDGTILAVNQRFAALCETPPEALVGHDWRERCAALLPAFPVAVVEASLQDGVARRERVRSSDGQGRARILDLHTLHPAEGAAMPEQLVVRLRDVTEQVRLEAQMVAAERLAANERLAATVAHEVNTPLQAIENSLHLAGKLADEEQRARYLRLAREEIQRVGFILRQLLELHRPSSAPAPINVNDLVERVLLLTGGSLRRQGIYVMRDLAAGLPTVLGRADELTQVLLNLIFNAMQAMARGGRLTMRTALEQPEGGVARVVISVIDNGMGVDPANIERIFEPFYTTRAEGSGLGLAVSRQLVEGHGGALWIESTLGEGATFFVGLPVAG